MFSLQQQKNKKNQNIIVCSNVDSEIRLNLDEGGRLEFLKLSNKLIIKELNNFSYENSYASAILFPFVSRVKEGLFTYKGICYQLECNNNSHALHGLVYNKPFQISNKEISEEKVTIKLKYKAEPALGFPFKYELYLIYTLSKNTFSLEIEINNMSNQEFPFTIGWHPYFNTSDTFKTFLNFSTLKKVKFDDELITKELKDYKDEVDICLNNKSLDDGFLLNSKKVHLITPEYKIELSSDVNPPFLQIYTPPNESAVAIEFQTGVSDSLNNGIGLKTIGAKEVKRFSWSVLLK